MKTYKTVLWATDGSDGAGFAGEEAIALATLTGAHLVAVHCDQRLSGRAGNWSALADEADIQDRIEADITQLGEEGVDIEFVVRHSRREAADVIAAIAAERDADVIVCGTRGRGALGGLFLGSFTQRLLHVAPCPVLAVPERKVVEASFEHEKSQVSA